MLAAAARCSHLSPTAAAARSPAQPSASPSKKVLVPIARGTEEMEAVVLTGVLRRAGADVVLASVEQGFEVEASLGTRIVADALIGACADQVFDLLALPGGMPGSVHLRDCDILKKMATRQADEKRLYGAICAAPAVVLMPWGLHKSKDITGHPGFWDNLPTFYAIDSSVVVSEQLTTSRGPGTTFQFALSFIEQLFGEAATEDMKRMLNMEEGQDLKSKEFNKVDWSSGRTPYVLVPVANGSDVMEVIVLVDILRRAGAEVTVASAEKSLRIVGCQDIRIVADKSISSAAESIYDIIILPGGKAGAERLHKSRILKKLLKSQKDTGKAYGGFCDSQITLHKQGLLEDKMVTAHPDLPGDLSGNTIDGAGFVIDGNLITGKGVGTAIEFSLAIVGKFFGQVRAKSVAKGIAFELPNSRDS